MAWTALVSWGNCPYCSGGLQGRYPRERASLLSTVGLLRGKCTNKTKKKLRNGIHRVLATTFHPHTIFHTGSLSCALLAAHSDRLFAFHSDVCLSPPRPSKGPQLKPPQGSSSLSDPIVALRSHDASIREEICSLKHTHIICAHSRWMQTTNTQQTLCLPNIRSTHRRPGELPRLVLSILCHCLTLSSAALLGASLPSSHHCSENNNKISRRATADKQMDWLEWQPEDLAVPTIRERKVWIYGCTKHTIWQLHKNGCI